MDLVGRVTRDWASGEQTRLLPEDLCKPAPYTRTGLESEVVTNGVIRRAEIWSRDTWLAEEEEGDAEVARTAARKGLTPHRRPES